MGLANSCASSRSLTPFSQINLVARWKGSGGETANPARVRSCMTPGVSAVNALQRTVPWGKPLGCHVSRMPRAADSAVSLINRLTSYNHPRRGSQCPMAFC
eukprot:6464737-Amphidinium_carterae.2